MIELTLEVEQFYCSAEIYERYAFDSYFKVTVLEDGNISSKQCIKRMLWYFKRLANE